MEPDGLDRIRGHPRRGRVRRGYERNRYSPVLATNAKGLETLVSGSIALSRSEPRTIAMYQICTEPLDLGLGVRPAQLETRTPIAVD